jgi:UDP-GlcNAc:undecaprenyl-phosphate/decaprenyl-phosphate GlcNAc-1-phosphate transferase
MININLIILLSLINIIFFIFFNKLNGLINLYDIPNKRKIHKNPTPSSGGFYLIINLSVLLLFYKSEYFDSKNLLLNLRHFYSFYFTILLIFFVGFIDDLVDLSALKKTFFLSIAIYMAILIDPDLIISNLHFSFADKIFYLKDISIFFTLFCIFIFISAFNMFDGTNLQSGLYSLSIIIIFILYSGYINLFLPIIAFLIFFIFYNSQGKIFLGNAGSHAMGFTLSWFFIKLYNKDIIPNVDEVILIMLIPGLDLARLFITRLIKNTAFFSADQNHIHHIIMNKFTGYKLQLIILFLVLFPITIFYLTKIFFLSLIFGIINYFVLIYTFKKN